MNGDSLEITSPAFENEGRIHDKYTCQGEDVSPPLKVENIPEGTKTLALVMEDPDAPGKTWIHWLVWNIQPTAEIPEGSAPSGAVQGKNDFGKLEYGGPCPPSGTHRYFFRLYALNASVDLPGGAAKEELERAMEGKVIQEATLMGTCGK